MNSLGIKSEYVKMVEQLPFIHRDPFDRLLIATALADGLTIITADESIQKYDIAWVW
jgi:PIN domain nuclease of toxin-antitoxin system